MPAFVKLFLLAHLIVSALAATYTQSDSIQGSGFLSAFTVQAISDPTHGRVYVFRAVQRPRVYFFIDRNYVDSTTAMQQNLTFASNDHFILRADSKTVLSTSGPGRNSVRLQSNQQYTTSVMVWARVLSSFEKMIINYPTLFSFNIRHMPQGCG